MRRKEHRRKFEYHVLRPDGTESAHSAEMENPKPQPDELKQLVEAHLDGGDMQRVRIVKADGSEVDMFVDDLAKAKKLPRNNAATALYRALWMHNNPRDDAEKLPFIAGVAVLFSEVVWRMLFWMLFLRLDGSDLFWHHSGAHCMWDVVCWT